MEQMNMQIKVKVGHCLGGGRDVYRDDLLEAPDDLTVKEAAQMVGKGYATFVTPPGSREADESAAPEGAAGPVKVTDGDVSDRDPPNPGATASKSTRRKRGGKKARTK